MRAENELWEEEERNLSQDLTRLSDGARGLCMNNRWGLREEEEQTFWRCWTRKFKGRAGMLVLRGLQFYWHGQWWFRPPLQCLVFALESSTDAGDITALKASHNTLALTYIVRLMVFTAWVVVVWRNEWTALRVLCCVEQGAPVVHLNPQCMSDLGYIWRSQLQLHCQHFNTATLDLRVFNTD